MKQTLPLSPLSCVSKWVICLFYDRGGVIHYGALLILVNSAFQIGPARFWKQCFADG